MADVDWALVSRRVVTPEAVRPAAVLVRGEQIAAVVGPTELPAGCHVEDVGELVVLPGLVDIHVHINEPGRTEWEGFATASRAAAAGGITTLVDMPLNSSPVTTTVDALRQKIAAARGQLWVDCGFHGGVVPGNADQIEPLTAAGVLGFKAFLCHSGIDDFPNVTEADLRAAMPKIAAAGLPLLVHAELVIRLPDVIEEEFAANPRSYAAYLASRPSLWECDAIRMMIGLCHEHRCRVHIVHLASAPGLALIHAARVKGLPLSVETCPHYLFFAAEDIPDGDPRFKCAPPLRAGTHRQELLRAVLDDRIDTIGSDHSPAPPALKELESGNLKRAWGGIASLQLSLCATWTALRRAALQEDESLPGFGLLANVMATRPAALVGLYNRKGRIAPGLDADLVVFDPNANWTVRAESLHHRHKITPYAGQTLMGRVERTYLRGRMIYERESGIADEPCGQVLLRGPASVRD